MHEVWGLWPHGEIIQKHQELKMKQFTVATTTYHVNNGVLGCPLVCLRRGGGGGTYNLAWLQALLL